MIALWAALAMVLQDILAVMMVQCENRRRGWAAGCLDATAWLCALVTNHYALNSVNGHNHVLMVIVVLAVTAANLIGSKVGQWMGDKFFPDEMEARLSRMEEEIKQLLAKVSPADH